ncbi:unnamed protein product [Orchesella dallaii]|uniref:Gustatory receptor n=1 Tax=Orchesella dallaii TaxID=48710 RepID=A0ABP1R6C8_9HEXA
MSQPQYLQTNFLRIYLKICKYLTVSLLDFDKYSNRLIVDQWKPVLICCKLHLFLAYSAVAASVVQTAHFHFSRNKEELPDSVYVGLCLQIAFFVLGHFAFCTLANVHLNSSDAIFNLHNAMIEFEKRFDCDCISKRAGKTTFILGNTIFNSLAAFAGHFFGSFSHPCTPHLVGYFLLEECQQGINKLIPVEGPFTKQHLLRGISMFRQIQIMLKVYNSIHEGPAILSAIFQTLFLLILSGYALIGLHSKMQSPQITFFVSGGFQAVIIIVLIFGTLDRIHRNFRKLNKNMRRMKDIRMSQWFKRELRSWPIQKVGLGQDNYLKSITPMIMIHFSITCIVNMLLIK